MWYRGYTLGVWIKFFAKHKVVDMWKLVRLDINHTIIMTRL